MSRYKPLFTVAIQHEYFDGGPCRDVALAPTDATFAAMAKLGLIARAGAGSIAVFYPDDREDVLHAAIADRDEAPNLTFRTRCENPYFSVYTHPSFRDCDGVLYFDSFGAKRSENAETLLMHEEAQVSAGNSKSLAELSKMGLASARERVCRDAILVNVRLEDTLEIPDKEFPGRNYAIRFASKRSRWRYYFFGELCDRDIQVADLDGAIAFERGGTIRFPGRKPGAIFLSTSPIPMRDIPNRRFQLREIKSKVERTLIKRLPNASVDQVCKEEFDGQGTFVSEIYVNC